jgi:hypothetical protein
MRGNSPSEPLVFEPEDIQIETTFGRRPASTAGERLMVGLAALALLAGALIAITNMLPGGSTEASQATASSSASRTARPTATPPPLRTIQLAGETPPAPAPNDNSYGGWVRALERIPVWSSHSSNASRVGTLWPGQAAWGETAPRSEGGPEWMQISGQEVGWIRSEVAGRAAVRRYSGAHRTGASIDFLVAGEGRFAAHGWGPTSVGNDGAVIVDSADGARWSAGLYPSAANGYEMQLAHGPSGWLLINMLEDDTGVGVWVWRSSDLRDWQVLGAMSDLQDAYVTDMVGSSAGYVVVTSGPGRGTAMNGQTVWYSADGLVWSERPIPSLPVETQLFLTATPIGFYLQSQAAAGDTVAAFSADGWTWTEVSADGLGTAVGVVAAGNQLVAIGRSNAAAQTWIGTIDGGELTWHEDVPAGAVFDDAFLTTVVSDGQRPIVLGRERGTDLPLWWSREAVIWQRHQLPAEYGGVPRVAAGGSAGYVLLESRQSAVGQNPRLWHLTGADTWEPERSPVIEFQEPPSATECGEPPTDVIELMVTDGLWFAECHGSRPLTLRAWSGVCQDCFGEAAGKYAVKWLSQPTDNQLLLSPIAFGDGWIEGVLPPSISLDPKWEHQWLRVTGHFDDPAAARCRWEPGPDEEEWYGGAAEMIDQCRSRFVISEVQRLRGS